MKYENFNQVKSIMEQIGILTQKVSELKQNPVTVDLRRSRGTSMGIPYMTISAEQNEMNDYPEYKQQAWGLIVHIITDLERQISKLKSELKEL